MVLRIGQHFHMDPTAFVLLVLFFISNGNGESFDSSNQQEAVVGDEVRMSCGNSDKTAIFWKHTPVGSQLENDLYVNGNVVKPHDKWFQVEQDFVTGDYSLTISSVQRTDSGTYSCMRADGDSEKHKTELTVLDSRPSCLVRDIIGENDCEIEKEDYRLTCTVGFSGNIPPAMECNNLDLGKLDSLGVVSNTVDNDKAVYSFVAKTSFKMDNKLVLCRTSLAHIPGNSVKASVAYVFDTSSRYTITSKDSFRCLANSNQPCSYSWHLSSLNKQLPGQTVDIHIAGTYQCFAKCSMAGRLCTVRPLLIRFEPEEEELQHIDLQPPPMHVSKKVVIIIVCVIVGVVVVSSIGIAFACAYRLLLSSSDPCPSIHYLWKIPTDSPRISGMAILKDSLYIVHRGEKHISVYQASSPCRFLGKITFEGLKDPRDIAVCLTNSCLYISDSGHGCVWKVDVGAGMATLDTKISAWVAKVDEPYTLAVISGGRVLMVQRPNTLRIYRVDGTVFRTFQIRGNIGEPQHAVRTSKGTFIVSHGDKYDKEHKVSEVSAKGEILRSFGNRRGESDAPCEETGLRLIRLSHPRHLAIDRSGRVLVVDMKNNRIIRLDRKLCLIEVLRCPGNVDDPVRLFCEAVRFLIGRGDAIYVHSIDYDDSRSPPQAVAVKKDSDESDSDNTDDVKPLLRKFQRNEPRQPLLSNQPRRQIQTFSPLADEGFFDDRAILRQRKLESQS